MVQRSTVRRLLRLPAWVHKSLWWLGYEIKPVLTHHWYVQQLLRLGFHPHTIIDVGVGFGTPTLYQAFPSAYYVLIEPLHEFESAMQAILEQYTGRYFLTALGDRDTTRVLHIDPAWPERGSMYTRMAIEASKHSLVPRQVPVTSLDALLARYDFQPPFGLKLDAEGCEYEIIQGAKHFLQQAEFVIAEVAVAERFHGGYAFRDFIDLMARHDFHLYDILATGRSHDQRLTFIDVVFRRRPGTDAR